MTLYQKILAIYPNLTIADFEPLIGTINLKNENDERGDYIAKWEHPTLAKPTDEELA